MCTGQPVGHLVGRTCWLWLGLHLWDSSVQSTRYWLYLSALSVTQQRQSCWIWKSKSIWAKQIEWKGKQGDKKRVIEGGSDKKIRKYANTEIRKWAKMWISKYTKWGKWRPPPLLVVSQKTAGPVIELKRMIKNLLLVSGQLEAINAYCVYR